MPFFLVFEVVCLFTLLLTAERASGPLRNRGWMLLRPASSLFLLYFYFSTRERERKEVYIYIHKRANVVTELFSLPPPLFLSLSSRIYTTESHASGRDLIFNRGAFVWESTIFHFRGISSHCRRWKKGGTFFSLLRLYVCALFKSAFFPFFMLVRDFYDDPRLRSALRGGD